MKKVLIISYYAPPCNLTASQRIGNWMKYLNEYGYSPIVITRSWSGKELSDADRVKTTSNSVEVVKLKESEIIYLPYKSNLRDHIFMLASKASFLGVISKLITLTNLLLQNIFVKRIPFANMYFYSKEYLRANKDISMVIISGNPFEQFFFGYLLKKEFPYIKWLADYRDDWTTNPLYFKKSYLFKFINQFNQKFEKKWIETASAISSVSQVYCNRLSAFHNKDCKLIANGYSQEIFNIKADESNNFFQFTYSGTIYPNQDFSIFFEAINKIAKKNPTNKFKLTFLGSKVFLPKNFENNLSNFILDNLEIELTGRINWEGSIQFLKKSDMLLLTPYGSLKGIPSSKIFEYIACNKPIILAPSDEDVMKQIIIDTQSGVIVNSSDEIVEFYENYVSNKCSIKFDDAKIKNYSAKHQVQQLALLLNNL